MNIDPDKVADEIAPVIAGAIDSANERAEERAEIAEKIIEGALETERANQVTKLEEDLNECISNQAILSETMAEMVSQLSEMKGQLSTLQILIPSMELTNAESVVADGPRESQELPEILPEPQEMPTLELPVPAKRKKKFILI